MGWLSIYNVPTGISLSPTPWQHESGLRLPDWRNAPVKRFSHVRGDWWSDTRFVGVIGWEVHPLGRAFLGKELLSLRDGIVGLAWSLEIGSLGERRVRAKVDWVRSR